ncbi:MAG TPA: BNR-4 repeat-containing protein [Verrucomicrobiae bacterium]
MTIPCVSRYFGLASLLFALVIPRITHGAANDDFPNDPLAKGAALDIDPAWSGHSVGFSFLTLKDVQIAAYYNQYRQVTLAARNMNSLQWYKVALNSTVGWDSHNYLTLTTDSLGYLHLSGNLHRNPMNYWRSSSPVTSASQFTNGFMTKLTTLVNTSTENDTTYPGFFLGPKEEFIFSYRNHTGNASGNWHLLRYSPSPKTFAHATGGAAVFNWTGNYSVYPNFVVNGGYVHCLWVWRGTTSADSNYRLSYMRTSNFTNWTDAFGRAVTLPVTPSQSLTTIDNVPQLGGLLNGQPKLSFDRDGVPLVAYHKYDSAGKSQVYAARPIAGSNVWNIVKLTTSSMRWEFTGGGSLPPGGSVGNTFSADDPLDGLATVSVSMVTAAGVTDTNSGPYVLDEMLLRKVLITFPNTASYTSANTPTSPNAYFDSSTPEINYTHDGDSMGVRRLRSGGLAYADQHYYLRWETLPAYRDAPRLDANGNPINPPPSTLRLYRTQCEFNTPTLDGALKMTGLMFKPATATRSGAMALTTDAKRPFGSYLSSSVITGSTNYAQWTFNVDYASDYALGGSTHSVAGTDDSFYVQLDGGTMVDWHVRGRWEFQPVTFGPLRPMIRFYLTPGTHTLRLYAREANAKLDYLWLNRPSTAKAPSLSPESYSGFVLTNNVNAVTGNSLTSPFGSNQATNIANYQIPIYANGNYLLLGRTRAQNGNSDSFFLSINGGSNYLWSVPHTTNLWTWRAVGTNMPLTTGTLNIDVKGREGGTELDSFMLLKVP